MRRALVVLLLAASVATASAQAEDDDYVHRARPGDTLIGLSARLLVDPALWPQLQSRNRIVDPRRIPVGSPIRIPTPWLRTSPAPAEVIALAGPAEADGRPLAVGDRVEEGAIVATAERASLTLRLADGSSVTLPQQSKLRLERMRRVEGEGTFDLRLELQSGSVESRATSKRDGGRFEIRTPFAVSAVRGTDFRTHFEPQARRSAAETLEGRTALSTTGGSVELPGGFGSSVAGDAAPSPPAELLPAPRLPQATAAFERVPVVVGFEAVPGAVAYVEQLAADPSFHTIVAQWRSAAPLIEVPDLDDGRYHLRVRAIDAAGLAGHDATLAVTVNARPLPPVITWRARAAASGAALDWTVSPGAVAYRVQVARDDGFADVVRFLERTTDHHLDLDGLAPGRYVARAAGIDERGEAGPWSAAVPFVVRPPPRVTAVRVTDARDVEIAWDGASDAGFVVELASDPQFTWIRRTESVAGAAATFARVTPGHYYVRVRAVDATGAAGPASEPVAVVVPVEWWAWLLPLLLLVVP